MKKKSLKPALAHTLASCGPTVLVTTSDGRRDNVMAAAWTIPLNWDPALMAVVIGEQAHSLKTIRKTRELALNIPGAKLLEQVLYCGSVCGEKVDKFAAAGLTKLKAKKIRPPLIAECAGHIECRVRKIEKYADAALVVCDVLAAAVDADKYDKFFRADKAATLHHLGGKTFGVINRLGKGK